MIEFLHKRASALGVSAVAVAILLSGCSSGAKSTPPATATPAVATGGQPTVSPSAAAGGEALQIGTRSIPGLGTVLVNGEGLTVYHLTTDTSTETTCTGGCAQVWPPLPATNGDQSSTGSDTFGTFKRPDGGVQLTFHGMLLYTYAGDSAPGQANGQGIGGTWFAVTS